MWTKERLCVWRVEGVKHLITLNCSVGETGQMWLLFQSKLQPNRRQMKRLWDYRLKAHRSCQQTHEGSSLTETAAPCGAQTPGCRCTTKSGCVSLPQPGYWTVSQRKSSSQNISPLSKCFTTEAETLIQRTKNKRIASDFTSFTTETNETDSRCYGNHDFLH